MKRHLSFLFEFFFCIVFSSLSFFLSVRIILTLFVSIEIRLYINKKKKKQNCMDCMDDEYV